MWLEAVVASLDSWWELLTDEKKNNTQKHLTLCFICVIQKKMRCWLNHMGKMMTESYLILWKRKIRLSCMLYIVFLYIFLKQSLFWIWEMRCRALIARYFFLCSFRGALIKVDYSWIWYTWFFSDLHSWKPLKASQLRSAWKPLKAKFCCLSSRVHIQDMENGDLFGIIIVCYLNRTSC